MRKNFKDIIFSWQKKEKIKQHVINREDFENEILLNVTLLFVKYWDYDKYFHVNTCFSSVFWNICYHVQAPTGNEIVFLKEGKNMIFASRHIEGISMNELILSQMTYEKNDQT